MLVMSYPHFLYADLQYRNGVLGMAPIAENHHIYLNIEPVSWKSYDRKSDV